MNIEAILSTIASFLPTIARLVTSGESDDRAAAQEAVLKEVSELLVAVSKLVASYGGTLPAPERSAQDLKLMEISEQLKKVRDRTRFAGGPVVAPDGGPPGTPSGEGWG